MKKLNNLSKILEGIGSLISLYPSKNRRKITLPSVSISSSLNKDWENIGRDMWEACRKIEIQDLEIKHNYKDTNDRLYKYTRRHFW